MSCCKSSLQDASFKHKRVFLYSSDEPDKKANAALLMALYAVSHELPCRSRDVLMGSVMGSGASSGLERLHR